MKKLFTVFGLLIYLTAYSQNISTIAGGLGDGGSAFNSPIEPYNTIIDATGNIFISDSYKNIVRKIDAITGIISVVAGTGNKGYSGDGGPATSADLYYPGGLALDGTGNIYIADYVNHRIRKVNASTGVITTVAGNGTAGYGGDGGAATTANLYNPHAIALDNFGNIYIADTRNQRIRKVNASNGIITTVAGNGTQGYGGDGGPATLANFYAPEAIALDNSGNIYIADNVNHRIRKVDALTGIINTVAGNGTGAYGGDGGAATSSNLYYPCGIAIDGLGNIYISDQSNHRIRKVNASTGIITTLAGNGIQSFGGDGGAATSANLNYPAGIAFDASGNIYIADTENHRIRKVNAITGIITTVVGNGFAYYGGDGGISTSANLCYPHGVAIDTLGNVYIADTENHRIRKVNVSNGIITTVIGNETQGYGGDNGVALSANLNSPSCLAIDASGNIYIADTWNHRIRKVNASTGIISTVAGNGTAGLGGDGNAATSAKLNTPTGVAIDNSGNIFIADQSNNRIRKVNASTGKISTVAGGGSGGDGGAATLASLNNPTGLAIDGSGNIFIADQLNNRIRKVNASTGIISTVAGNGTQGYGGNNIAATSASLNNPSGVAVDDSGNIYIADYYNNQIRKVKALTGIISTVAGIGYSLFSGDFGAATSANLYYPYGVTLDRSGNIFIADSKNNRIRKVTFVSQITGNIISGVQTICSGLTPASLIGSTPTGGTGSFTYLWLSSTTSATAGFTAIASSNSPNYSPGALSQTTWYKRVVILGTSSDISDAIQITVNTAVANNNITSSPQIICSGSIPAQITASTATGGNGATYTYQWLNSTTSATTGFNAIASSSTQNYTPGALTQTTWYRRIVASGVCKADTSAALQVSVNTTVVNNTIITQPYSICSGATPTSLTGSTPMCGNGTYTYSWLSSTTNATSGFIAIASSNTINYSPGALTQTTWYKRVVNSGAANDTTAAIQVTVNNTIANNSISSSPQIICSGSIPALLTANPATGGNGATYTYQWLSSTSNATTGFSAISSSNVQNYTPGVLTQTTWFRRRVVSGVCNADTTAAIQITVNNSISNNIITSTPQTICSGSTPAQITASTATGGNAVNYKYSWLSSTTGANSGFVLIDTTIQYTPGALTQTTWYRRRVESGVCIADTSTAIQVSVNNAIANNLIIGSPQIICSGSTPAQITASTATGGNGATYIYSWLSSTSNATTGFSALTSSNTQNIKPSALTQTTWFRRRVASGVCNADTTAAIQVSVNNAIANNIIISTPQTICSGSTPTQITASTATGGDGLAYAYTWLSSTTNATSGFSVISSSNVQNYTPGVLTQTTWYRRRVESGVCAADTSTAIQITVNNAISNNTISGSPQTICSGSTPAQINASSANGGDGLAYTYTWLSSTTNAITGFSAITSSNVQNYTPGVLTQTTWFRRRVASGVCNADTTAAIQVSVNNVIANNIITSTPQAICSGSTPAQINASAATGGDGLAYTYTWLSSTSNATTGFSVISSSNVQNYTPGVLTQTTWFRRRVVSGVCAADTSAALQVTVNNAISNNYITSLPQVIVLGSSPTQITAKVSTGGDGSTYTYTWLSSTTNATTGFSAIASSNVQNYTPGTLLQTTWFRRRVASGVCAPDTTSALQITVTNDSSIITTIAGNGYPGFEIDGVPAISTRLNPIGVAIDGTGNVYIADKINNRIRKVLASTGIIITVAGNSFCSYGGDGGIATSAFLRNLNGVALDVSGNIYIADTYNNRIRKVNATSGIINTIAGNGTYNYSGDNGLATSAGLNTPNGVAIDGIRNIFIADAGNNRIRKIDVLTGIISTVAGNGIGAFAGDGSAATSASLQNPFGVAVDSSGNIYIADTYNNRIRKVDASTGIISTIAGKGTGGFGGDGNLATSASLQNPSGVAIDGFGNIYIADYGNHRIRKVSATTGIITTVAGNGIQSFGGDGAAATLANLDNPKGVALDALGNIYIADYGNNRIRKVTFSKSSSDVNNILSNETQVLVYPNPAKDQLNIEINNFEKQKADLYDITGKLVKGGIVFAKQTVIDISEFQKGLYFLNISNGKQFISRKIVVE